jgi:DNA-binding response OmpR family regulator
VPRFLIASADAGTREFVRRAFAKFAVEAEECEGAMEAFAHLDRRYDGVVLDCEDVELAVQLVGGIRSSNAGSEGTTSVIALLPGEAALHTVLSAGAVLALHKPLRRLEPLVAGMRICFRLTPAAEKPAAAKPATAAKAKEEGRARARPAVSRK